MKLWDKIRAWVTGKPFPTVAYVARDKTGIALAWMDQTPAKAVKFAYRHGGPIFDHRGKRVEAKDAADHFVVLPATAALVAQIEQEGLKIKWEELYGVACTVEEKKEYLKG